MHRDVKVHQQIDATTIFEDEAVQKLNVQVPENRHHQQ
jgi:hypothetical protein